MKSALRDVYTTLRSEGALLPPDLLQRVADGDKNLAGLTPADYHCEGEKLNEAASRAWQRLQGRWATFEAQREALSPVDPATTVTRERWLLPLFQELGYGRLQTTSAIALDGKDYPVSHLWASVPIHLVGCNVKLDTRTTGVAGAARSSPHSLVQELLNRSGGHLWAFVSNGLQLRILRDSVSLSRQAYVEFDLETMMRGELYADFVLMWLFCHESRVEGDRAEECWLERWSQEAQQQGLRALDGLRRGVEKAIEALGRGFLTGGNRELLEKLRSGELDSTAYYRQLLRLVYRLLFLFTAEDRELLLLPLPEGNEDEAKRLLASRARYLRFYSSARLRELAAKRRGSRHTDLFEGLELVMRWLGSDEGCPALALPALGGFLFSEEALLDLAGCRLANSDLLQAVRELAFTVDARVLRPIDFRNLGAEELGSVYESLLEMQPAVNRETARFALRVVSGSERKTTGSYYTPSSLIQCVLDSALNPVVDDCLKVASPDARERALLDLKVCDPACGSGHFLIAAAHRLARRLAAVRTGDDEPAPEATRQALRDVIGHCIYGVDINPMAVELCKVNLWMEALEPGKPLSFLDHHVRAGDSLLGATPELVASGIPDGAFGALTGDDNRACTLLMRRNRAERSGIGGLFAMQDVEARSQLQKAAAALEEMPEERPEGVRAKERAFHHLEQTAEYQKKKLICDVWCGAFLIRKSFGEPGLDRSAWGLTQSNLDGLASGQSLPPNLSAEVERLAGLYGLFHWHLAFPEAFARGGFDCVLGNPPWERVKLERAEWFAGHGRDDIANARNAAVRERMIEELRDEDPTLFGIYQDALHAADAQSAYLRRSGAYPLSGTGDVNTYAIFTELATRIVAPSGMVGLVIPTGLATDDQLKGFFSTLTTEERLASLTGFENEEFLFPGIANVVRYAAIAIGGSSRRSQKPRFAFFIRNASQIQEEDRYYTLGRGEIARLNPNTGTCPIFRTRDDADLTLRLYTRFPVLRASNPAANPWGLSYLGMFHMANDSRLFRSEPAPNRLPLYEAKLIWHYDHRFGSYELKGVLKGKGGRGLPDMPLENHRDPTYTITPQYWVDAVEVEKRLSKRWGRSWLLAYRTTSSAKLERTLVAAALPVSAVNHKAPIMLLEEPQRRAAHLFLACFNSLVLDYIARQKVGGTDVGYFHLDQLPFPTPADFSDEDDAFIRPRVLELTFTAEDVRPFAEELGWSGNPFAWDPERRHTIQCELDAYLAHKYGLSRDDWRFVLDPHDSHGPAYPGESFRVLQEKEVARFGEYRTKRICLEAYDRLASCKVTPSEYEPFVDPPPGSPEVTWRDREPGGLAPASV